jgi:predicted RNA binding protein YcfA (HicA-like mRNA interferase family)
MKFRELEKQLINDGWVFKCAKGSHWQYVHPAKCGKVTIPHHTGDIPLIVVRSVLRQAGIKENGR